MPLTFAYGSNLDCTQMRNRCPSTRFICIAVLPDHTLSFPRFSRGRGCGVASVSPLAGKVVWGVVYEISATDLAELDRHEGYRIGRQEQENAYNRRTITVWKNGDLNNPLAVETYFATPQENAPYPPNHAYKTLIVNGAFFWKLPVDYRIEIEHIEVAE